MRKQSATVCYNLSDMGFKIMKILFIVMGLLVFIMNSVCCADEYEIELMAGDSTFETGIHYKEKLPYGFIKAGGYYLQTDEDNLEYQRWLVDFTFGSEMISTGMIWEMGLAGIFGKAEKDVIYTELVVDETTGADPVGEEATETYSSDLCVVAFITKIGYFFPEDVMTFPLELYGRIIYAPGSICFGDTENYLSYQLGAGIRIVKYASFMMQFSAFDVGLESGEHNWDFDDSSVQLGLVFRFY